MNNINLLPKVPLLTRIFIPVLLSILFLFIFSGSLVYFYSLQVKSKIAGSHRNIASQQAIINQMVKARQVDQRTKDYQTFLNDINRLKSSRRDWLPVLQGITSSLPQKARMQNLSTSDLNSVVANFEFSSIMEVAEYMTALQQNSLVSGVEVKGITRVQKKLTHAEPAKAKNTPPQQKAGNSNSPDKPQTSAADKSNVPPVEEIVKLMEQGIVQPTNEGDKLLNQLTWMVNEQLVKEKYGIDIKDAAALEEFKKKYSAKVADTPANADRPDTGKPASTAGTVVAASLAGTPKAAEHTNEVAVYQVSMNIALKPLTQAK